MNNLQATINDLVNLNHRELWQPFMEKYDCQTICEVGVRIGVNFRSMIAHEPKLAVAVDSWKDDGVRSRNDEGFSQDILDRRYERVKNSFKDKRFVQIYRGYSKDVAKRFPNNFFDLIYIDADHSFEGCYEDLVNWYPKVKKGKFIIGDDYIAMGVLKTKVVFGVIEAVNLFAKKNNLTVHKLPRSGWAFIRK